MLQRIARLAGRIDDLLTSRPPGRHSRAHLVRAHAVSACTPPGITPFAELRTMSDAEQHARLGSLVRDLMAVDPDVDRQGAMW